MHDSNRLIADAVFTETYYNSSYSHACTWNKTMHNGTAYTAQNKATAFPHLMLTTKFDHTEQSVRSRDYLCCMGK